ncbi:MAG TPA: DUF2807 domain-containing protein, partial [Rhodanobacteraceae bacterium]
GLKLLMVQIGPDDLVIHGEPGQTKIVVHGTACASNPKWLSDITVATARRGSGGSVVAHDGEHFSLFGSAYAYLKLDVSVPQSLAIKLQEGSGDASARNLASLDAALGSGDLKADGVAGALRLSVGSGDAEATQVGSLHLTSLGSGDAKVDGVAGDARVDSVGSGDLALHNVKGNVSIGSIGSGDAKVMGVGGNLKVDSVGSGDLVVHDAKGSVSVGALASGDVGVEQVSGDFSVGAVGSGDVHHHGVQGKVSVPRSDD